jgi:hypothetical protein
MSLRSTAFAVNRRVLATAPGLSAAAPGLPGATQAILAVIWI